MCTVNVLRIFDVCCYFVTHTDCLVRDVVSYYSYSHVLSHCFSVGYAQPRTQLDPPSMQSFKAVDSVIDNGPDHGYLKAVLIESHSCAMLRTLPIICINLPYFAYASKAEWTSRRKRIAETHLNLLRSGWRESKVQNATSWYTVNVWVDCKLYCRFASVSDVLRHTCAWAWLHTNRYKMNINELTWYDI